MAAHINPFREGTGRSIALCACALAFLLAPPASAQQFSDVVVETSEGSFTIDIFDFPDLEEHARVFLQSVETRMPRAVFHRGDKLITCERDPTPEYCFLCECNLGFCELDPNQRTCEPEQEGEMFWLIDDQTQPAPYLQAGRFQLSELYDLEELVDDMPPELANPLTGESLPVFSNTAFTVAFVRVDDGMGGATLTSEWIINLEDNPELNDPFGRDSEDFSEAYYVFGAVTLGREVVSAIGGQKTYDASNDASVDPVLISTDELEQVPVFDTFSGEPGSGDLFIDPCDDEITEPDDTVCRTPACMTETIDQLACLDPRCVSLIPLTEEEQELVDDGIFVQRFCDAPALPSFPIIVVPEPGLIGLLTGLVALAGLAARRRH